MLTNRHVFSKKDVAGPALNIKPSALNCQF
jgi:hypothetical protein